MICCDFVVIGIIVFACIYKNPHVGKHESIIRLIFEGVWKLDAECDELSVGEVWDV